MVRRMLLCLAFVFVAQLAVAGDTKDGTVKSVAGSSFVVTEASKSMSSAISGSDSLIALVPASTANFALKVWMRFTTSVAPAATSVTAIPAGRASAAGLA